MLLLLLFVRCFCLNFSLAPVGRSAGRPVNRAFHRSTGQPARSAGQPGSTGQPARSAGQPGSPRVSRSTGQPARSAGQPGNWPGQPVNRGVHRSTGQPARSAGQPGSPRVSRATGQPGREGANRDPVSRLPGPVARLPPHSQDGNQVGIILI